MPFPAENLNVDEKVILDLRPHWWFFAKQALALFVTIVIGIVTLVLGAPPPVQIAAAVAILGALIYFLVRYAVWSATNFVITSDRLIDRSGVLNRQGTEIPLERVNTVFFKQTLFARLIGSGDLIIESAGEQGAQLVSAIRKPLNVQNEIYRQMEANENRKFDRVGQNLGAGAGDGGTSIPHQIEKLAELHSRGVLTDVEFQTKKKQLLDRM